MTDTLRYRVWDKKNNVMYYPRILCINNTSQTINFAYKGKDIGFCWEYCIIEQCTGLKDKKNNLIYEGDIIYIAGYGNYIVDAEEGFIELWDRVTSGNYDDVGSILGNIHENKELIER